MRALTVKQPHASLIVAGVKPVENRTWPVPSTLPRWYRCRLCRERRPSGWIADNGLCPRSSTSVCFGPGDGPFPFRLAIHAGTKRDRADRAAHAAVLAAEQVPGGHFLALDAQSCGVLLGYVTVTGCHHASECAQDETCSPWAEPNTYHWTLTDPVEFPEPIPYKGRQGLWTIPDDVLAEVAA